VSTSTTSTPVPSDTPPGSGARPASDTRDGRVVPAWLQRVVTRLSAGDGTFPAPPPSDVLLALGIAALGVAAEVTQLEGTPTHGLLVSAPRWVGWLTLLAAVLPLVWRRVTPGIVMPLTGFVVGFGSLVGSTNPALVVAVLVALYSVTAYGTREDGWWAIGISCGFITSGIVVSAWNGDGVDPVQAAISVFIFVGVWALGERTRGRRELVAQLTARADEAERHRELVTELAVADERRRIARELHDVVAHAVSVVVVQAGAGRHVAASDPDAAADSLAAIESTGRDAMIELRRLVDVLRADGGLGGSDGARAADRGPQPCLEDVATLVARVRAAGLPVELHDVGPRGRLPRALELSAVRIVQESLTNVLKHAGAVGLVEVVVERRPNELTVTVEDDGDGPRSGPGGRTGTGIVGMRERVAVFGGSLLAGAGPRGGFRVRARLPIAPETDP
jgi:signal transduction histidine kinase